MLVKQSSLMNIFIYKISKISCHIDMHMHNKQHILYKNKAVLVLGF